MKKTLLLLIIVIALPALCPPAGAAPPKKVSKETITSQGKKRAYYLYVPESVKASAPAPLVLLLHGSNRNGLTLVDKWKDLADKEGFIVAGPDSADSAVWRVPGDGPDFLRELAESLKREHPVDARRVYLFGHSAGAGFALLMALYESEYYAAVAIHAGALRPDSFPLMERAPRKTPISIQVGTNDAFFPLGAVRATRDALGAQSFPVELTEIPGHTHWYYDEAPKINRRAWEFLKRHELAAAPRAEERRFGGGAASSGGAVGSYNEGVRKHQSGDLAGAVAAYTRALELDPQLSDAYNNRGAALHGLGKYAEALEDLSLSLQLRPTEGAYNNRGAVHRALGKPKEAVTDFTRALELRPSAQAYFNRGMAREETGDLDSALDDFTRAVGLDAKFAPAYANRGRILMLRGKDAEAQKDFDAAFGLDPALRAQFEPAIRAIRAGRGVTRP